MLFRMRLAQIIGPTTPVALPIAVATKKMLALSKRDQSINWNYLGLLLTTAVAG